MIRKVVYFSMQVPNRPGVGLEMLRSIAKGKQNLLAFTGFPNGGKAQVDFVQAQTIQNKKALEEKDPVIRRQHLDDLRRISEDVKLHKQYLYRSALFDSLNSANAVE